MYSLGTGAWQTRNKVVAMLNLIEVDSENVAGYF